MLLTFIRLLFQSTGFCFQSTTVELFLLLLDPLLALRELHQVAFQVVDAGTLNLRGLRTFVGAAIKGLPFGLPGLPLLFGLLPCLA
jgi:hypothetical protein